MSEVTISFNGQDLSDLIEIHDIRRDIGNETTYQSIKLTHTGISLQDVKEDAKFIEVDFSIFTRDRNSLKHRLAAIFKTDEPKILKFSDEPDKYYFAQKIGRIRMQEQTGYRSSGMVTFIVPDGVAHSTTYRRFDTPSATNDKLVFNLVNNGSAPAHPIISIKHNGENGYIGLVNQSGAFELGNREEANSENVKQSELLFDYRDNSILTGFSRAAKNVAINNDRMQELNSTLNTVSVWGRQHIFLQTPGGTRGYNAGSLTWTIPVDSTGGVGSLNDYIWWRQIFWLGAANQFGFIKVSVSDTDGNFLYGVETYKRAHGLGCEYNFMASNGKGGYNVIKQWTFTGTHWDYHNPFNAERGWSDIKRNDDKVQVYWWGSYPVFTIPEIKGKKSAKVHVTIGSIGNNPVVSHMYLDGICYRKDFVSVTKDIPNRFAVGSNVVINSEDDTVYIDGIAKIGEVVDGSQWLTIPPGTSQLEMYVSSFVRNKPTVKIEFEERWL
ncbi:TPA: distal tail protein Dit [Streptococcus suis]